MRGLGFRHVVAGALNDAAQVDDQFCAELGGDAGPTSFWTFSEFTDGALRDGAPIFDDDHVPVGLRKTAAYGLKNVVLEVDTCAAFWEDRAVSAFADGVAVVSLESSSVMDMHPPPPPENEPVTSASIPARLDPGDVLFLADDARWRWRHGISKRRWDPIGEGGTLQPRGHRTSVTLRAMRDEVHELRVAA